MVKYTINLKPKDSQDLNEEYRYSLGLTLQQENNPEQIFTSEIRESMRSNLQSQSACEVNNHQLNQIIKNWLEDIKEGYRFSSVTLELRPLIYSKIDQLQEGGNQEIPTLVYPDSSEIMPLWGMLPPLNFC